MNEGGTSKRKAPRTSGGLYVAAGFLSCLLIAGAVSFAVREPGGATGTPDLSSTVNPPKTTATAESGSNEFAIPEVDRWGRRVDVPRSAAGQLRPQSAPAKTPGTSTWSTGAPEGLREQGGWQRVHGVVVPFSTSDGPTWVRDDVVGGYAHTPQGAALAAAMSMYQLAARPGDRAVLQHRTALSPSELAAFDDGIHSGKFPVQQPESVTRWLTAPSAFRIDSYAEDLAVVSLAVPGETTSVGALWRTTAIPMVWTAGDWKLRGNGVPLNSTKTYDLSGWTTWY